MFKPARCLLILLISIWMLSTASANEIERFKTAVNTKLKAQEDALTSQNKIDKLAGETQELIQQYRETIRKTDSLRIYNAQLSNLIKQQKKDMNAIRRQLDNVEETQRGIVPLMLKMIETLEQFVSLDLPFLRSERLQRVANLKATMDRPDVTLPDKYRRIMQSYQIEMEYGRTIEAYNEAINIDDQEYTVDILRVGRLLILFQTLDGKLSGLWNKTAMTWDTLSSKYNRTIKKGLQIARKQAPPELIKLPIQIEPL